MDVKMSLAALASVTIAASPVLAQTTPPPPAGSTHAIPEKRGEPLQSGRSESLSKHLSKTDGVIKPKTNVDPGMKAPMPKPGAHTMPVIPPSATGGNTAK